MHLGVLLRSLKFEIILKVTFESAFEKKNPEVDAKVKTPPGPNLLLEERLLGFYFSESANPNTQLCPKCNFLKKEKIKANQNGASLN